MRACMHARARRDSMGRSDAAGAHLPAHKSWLVTSHTADNPVVVLAVMQQTRIPARTALEVGRCILHCLLACLLVRLA